MQANEPEKRPPPGYGPGEDLSKWERFQDLLSRRTADWNSLSPDEGEELERLSLECADYGIDPELAQLTETLTGEWSRADQVKRLDYLLGCMAEGQHLTPDESAEVERLSAEVGDDWRLKHGPKRREVPKDLHETFAWWERWEQDMARSWREFLFEHGDRRYEGIKALETWFKRRQRVALEVSDLLKAKVKPEDLSAFLEWYGHELLRLAAELPGEQGERFQRAAGVVSRDKRESAHRPSKQRSQNQNWTARADQDHFSYADVAFLAGCSVRQAKRVLTELYGLERKGARRWFSREQVKAAFPHAIPG